MKFLQQLRKWTYIVLIADIVTIVLIILMTQFSVFLTTTIVPYFIMASLFLGVVLFINYRQKPEGRISERLREGILVALICSLATIILIYLITAFSLFLVSKCVPYLLFAAIIIAVLLFLTRSRTEPKAEV